MRLGFPVSSTLQFTASWTRDGVPLAAAEAPVLAFENLRLADAGIYQLHVSNALGVATGPEVTLTVDLGATHPGSIDVAFHTGAARPSRPVVPFGSGIEGAVLVGDHVYVFSEHDPFVAFDGHATTNLARLTSDGVVDPTFVMLRDDPDVHRLRGVTEVLALRDGRMLTVLHFDYEPARPDEPVYRLVALRPNGSIDPSFNLEPRPEVWLHPIGPVAEVADGRVLVAGTFSGSKSEEPLRLVRVLPNGDLDPDFQSLADRNVIPTLLLPEANGCFLAVLQDRSTAAPSGKPIERLCRFLANGAPDPEFRMDPSLDGAFSCIAMDCQNRILAAYNRPDSTNPDLPLLVRIQPNGVLDPSFQLALNPQLPDSTWITALGIQRDCRILAAVVNFGYLPEIQGAPRSLIRLMPDGTQDPEFEFSMGIVSPVIRSIWITSQEQILIAGPYGLSHEGGEGPFRPGIARINAFDERRIHDFRVDPTGISGLLRTRPNHQYFVETTEDPAMADWDTLTVMDGDGCSKRFDDVPFRQRFYRLRLEGSVIDR